MSGRGEVQGNILPEYCTSRVAQWKRAGPITQRSEDRNLALLPLLNTRKYFCSTHLLQVSKKSRFYTFFFFHDLIHVYSPGAGAYSPQGTKF